MAVEVNDVTEFESLGLVISDPETGERQLLISVGDGEPYGTAVAFPTLYVDKLTRDVWRSVGTGANDWEKLEWGKNFSPHCIDEPLCIPSKQSLVTPSIAVEPTGSLTITIDGKVRIL